VAAAPRAKVADPTRAITVQPNMGSGFGGDVKFSPDGRYLVEGNSVQIRLWDLRSGRPLRTFDHFAYFQQFVFIEDGKQILAVHKDGWIRTWDPITGNMVSATKLPAVEGGTNLPTIFHAPTSNLVALPFQGGPIMLWDYARKRPAHTFPFSSDGTSGGSPDAVWLSPDGARLVAIEESVVKIFDVRANKVSRTIQLRKGYTLASAAGLLSDRLLVAKTAVADCDADIVLVDIGQGEPKYQLLDPAPRCSRKADGEIDGTVSVEAIHLHYQMNQRRLYISRKGASGSKAWDVVSGRPVESETTLARQKGTLIAIDDHFSRAVFEEDESALAILDIANGRRISTLRAQGAGGQFAVASADGKQIMLMNEVDTTISLATLSIEGTVPRFNRVRLPEGFAMRHAVPDVDLIVASNDVQEIVILSSLTSAVVARFDQKEFSEIDIARLSPDGKHLLLRGSLHATGNATTLIDVATQKTLLTFAERRVRRKDSVNDKEWASAFVVSPDGQRLAVGWSDGEAEIWSLGTRRLLRRLERADDQTTSLAFSPDRRYLVGGSRDSGVFVWDASNGKLLRELKREVIAGHVNTGSVAISHDGELVAAGPGQRAVSSGDEGRERRVHVWETATGKLRFLLSGHDANVTALAFTMDGRWIVSGSVDGTVRYWDRKSGRLAATFAATPDGRWSIITENGFFAASLDAGDLLSVVRGFDATSIEQIWQSLYAPDLVRALIAGDPEGEVAAATSASQLDAVLDSGPAPVVEIVATAPRSGAEAELIKIEARITDRGKGIGRIEWRANGVTVAVAQAPIVASGVAVVAQEIFLDPGDNTIEVVAYNEANLLASIPARTTLQLDASAISNSAKHILHILAVGINDYSDRGWRPPGAAEATYFPKLELAANDAITFANDLMQASLGLYDDVQVTLAIDQDATRSGLDAAFARLAETIHPRDTFVLFVAAHGKSERGRFYIIPQDFQSGPDALASSAISQDMLQDWMANRIKARKALILLDTCESGALIAGHLRSRTEAADSDAALGRLHEAIGRPVLTAAASGKPALEGYNTHGVFTWALLDALRNGDANGNGTIELLEFAAHVQDRVPRISAELQGLGRAAVAIAVRATASTAPTAQTARFGSRGENFAVARKLSSSPAWKSFTSDIVRPGSAVASSAAPASQIGPAGDASREGRSQSKEYRPHLGFALHGGDLENLRGHDRSSCEAQCRSRSECAAFVFDRWNKWCHLKTSVAVLRRHPKYDTFVDASSATPEISSSPAKMMRLRAKAFRDDQPYATAKAGSYDACEEVCRKDAKCSGLGFAGAGGTCRLYSTLGEYFSAAGVDSGYKEQDPP
jgi:WD40 repeat protein/uncharacterized caspase-like protein